MKNTQNKFIAILTLIFVFLITMINVVNATETTSLSLAPATGKLIIHKYLIEDISEATSAGTGEVVDPGNLPETATPLSEITFNLYLIDTPDITNVSGNGLYPAKGDFTLDDVDNPSKLTDANSNEFEVSTASVSSVTTNSSGIGETTLPRGIYLVIEQESPKTNFPIAPFIVSVPMTNPAGTGWMEEVNVYPKNEDLRIKKYVSSDTVTIGEEVLYTLTASIPSNIDKATTFEIKDTLNSVAEYKENSLSINVAMTEDGLSSGTSVTNTDYFTFTKTGNELKLEFTEDGFNYLYNSGTRYKYIEVQFTAKVTKGILDLTKHIYPNQGVVTFIPENDTTKTKTRTSSAISVHTGSVEVLALIRQ